MYAKLARDLCAFTDKIILFQSMLYEGLHLLWKKVKKKKKKKGRECVQHIQ